MKTFIAFSGGVESTTMALLFGDAAQCVFTDTGAEHKAMYERIDLVEQKLKQIHGDNFSILRVKTIECDGKPIDNLPDYIRYTGIFPNQLMRFCTKYFKIKPYNEFLKNKLPCRMMVGLNSDETEKREGNHGMKDVEIVYPLADLGMTRQDCIDLLKQHDLEPKLPIYMRRGGCKFCPYKSRREYIAMIHLAPEEMEENARLEEEVNQSQSSTRLKFWSAANSVPEGFRKLIETEKSQSLFSASELYQDNPGTIESPCGAFCHR